MVKIIVLLLIIVVVAALVWILRRQSGGTGMRSKLQGRGSSSGSVRSAVARRDGLEKLRENPLFWGVEMGQPGCEAAHALLGQQFPFDDAPQLPLPGCDSPNCTCQFKGLTNRRKRGERRQQEDRRAALRFDKDRPPDRRSRKDRRRDNVWVDHDY